MKIHDTCAFTAVEDLSLKSCLRFWPCALAAQALLPPGRLLGVLACEVLPCWLQSAAFGALAAFALCSAIKSLQAESPRLIWTVILN
jgi:hypothetical protein